MPSSFPLTQLLCAASGRPLPEAARCAPLEAALSAAHAAGRASYPGVLLPAEQFVAHLARRLPPGDPAVLLASLRADDLYLACACLGADSAALDELDRRFLSQVPRHVARFARSPDFADEVQQELRQVLLLGRRASAATGESEPGRIGDYSGQGDLARFIRVAAVRTAISLQRLEKPASSDEMLETLLPGPDPELDFVKLRDRGAVRAAILDAIASLERKDLGLLRLHYIEMVSLEKLALVHRVHRATMARWLASAREAVLRRARALLRERLKLSPSECDSLIDLVRSRLDASLSRALRDRPQ